MPFLDAYFHSNFLISADKESLVRGYERHGIVKKIIAFGIWSVLILT